MIYLPDTNAISVFLRGQDPQLNQLMTDHWEDLRLSTIVIAEREYGIIRHKSGQRYKDKFEGMVKLLPQVDFNREDATQYAAIRTKLERVGRGIGPMDTLIAAQALRLGATIVTHNLAEFKRVPKLKVVDWQTPSA
jgi:tRNA(fMet)-specific endonuclease VapC